MTKPFLFVNSSIKVSDKNITPSWELFSVGASNLMHAAWNPEKQLLVCQFDSVKENFIEVPQVAKTGKITTVDKRIDQYYRVTIEDKEAIKYMLENLCMNYTNQEWDLKYTPVPEEEQVTLDN